MMRLAGLVILSAVAVFTAVGGTIADWNHTHLFNEAWPPHARFHNAHTMAMGTMLGLTALFFLWRRGGDRDTNVLAGAVLASIYWTTQAAAGFYPGTGWTDPRFLDDGQSLGQFPNILDVLQTITLLAIVAGFAMTKFARARTA